MLEGSVLLNLAVVIACLLIAMTVHEFTHAYVGYLLGDSTAKDEGRISLNPLRHIDPLMTILLPAVTWVFLHAFIMAAKPVPFNPRRVKYEEFGAAMIAASGPLSNLVLAVMTALVLQGTNFGGGVGEILKLFMHLNVLLFVFNLIPIPPLDGSRVLYAFAPRPLQELMDRIEPYGLIVLIFLLMFAGLGAFVSALAQNVLNVLP